MDSKVINFHYLRNVLATGDFGRLKELNQSGYAVDEWTYYSAAGCNSLDLLKYIRENLDNPDGWNHLTYHNIASTGNLDCLKYAHENGCVWDHMFIPYAVREGHLDCIKYAFDNGCPYNDLVISYMFTSSEITLECFTYVIELIGDKYKPSFDDYRQLIISDLVNCFKYVHEKGYIREEDLDTFYSIARENGSTECLRYLSNKIRGPPQNIKNEPCTTSTDDVYSPCNISTLEKNMADYFKNKVDISS